MRSLLLVLFGGLGLSACEPADDGTTDKDPTETDVDGDGYNADEDCNDEDATINPAAAEACDSADNDCDGETDESGGAFFPDTDGDGFGASTGEVDVCTAPSGFVADNTDCDDTNAAINPGATEVCDEGRVDDDCDGAPDDADTEASGKAVWYDDDDADGFGDDGSTVSACHQPEGYLANGGDCNDADSRAWTGAAESCDGVDNNCDGTVDEGLTSTYYADADQDGYGDEAEAASFCDDPGTGYSAIAGDCDDANADASPDGAEVCNGIDDDCDGYTDDADADVSGTSSWYVDADADGYGDASMSISMCEAAEGYVSDATDCDDANAAINPGADEVCDATDTDDDCDGLADDADDSIVDATIWYVDADGDGGGDSDYPLVACEQPAGYVDNMTDPFEDAVLSDFASDAGLEETADVAVGTSAVYAVGYTADGDAAVVSIDPSTGIVTQLWVGEPLADPTGVALSADGLTLFVADVAAETTLGNTAGDIFEVSVSGGTVSAMGFEGTMDMPADVALSADGSALYISALNAAGSPALFTASVSGGSATEVFSGSPLVDPLALDASPDDSALYVVDSLASDGLGAVFVFETAGWSYQETLAWGFNVAFPGGVAADDSGTSVLYTSMSDAALTLLMTDGSGFEVIDTGALLYLPAGVSIYGETAYVAELSSEASSDLYLLTF